MEVRCIGISHNQYIFPAGLLLSHVGFQRWREPSWTMTSWQDDKEWWNTCQHISLQWSCFSLTLHQNTLHTECQTLPCCIRIIYLMYSTLYRGNVGIWINHTEELQIPTLLFFSGLSRFGLEAISAEQFSDCQQVFGPGHFGWWRLIGVTHAVNIIEFLYSSLLTHAGALRHFYSCGSCFSPIGAQATVRLLENEPNITVQAGHVSHHQFLPKASHNCHFHEVLWRGTELNLLRSREEPVERFLQRLGLSQSLSQICRQTS